MDLAETSLKQKAVLWPISGTDTYGKPQTGTAVEIDVRWEEVKRTVVRQDGTTLTVDGVIGVDRVVMEGSLLRLGELASLPSPATNLREVVLYEEVPPIKGYGTPERSVGVIVRDDLAL